MANALGDSIRQAREARGLSLSDVSARTKIAVHALRDIEAEAFDRLPAGVFRRAYLRTYAATLGLDGDALVHAYADRWEPPPPPEPEPRLSSWSDARLRVLLAVLIVVGAAAATTLVKSVWRVTTDAAASAREAETRATVAAPATPPVPVSAALRLRIRATRDCWMSATADGKTVVRRLVRAGETVNIDAASTIVLHLGDAGAVASTINGRRARPLGERGETVTVRMTPATYEAWLAAAESED